MDGDSDDDEDDDDDQEEVEEEEEEEEEERAPLPSRTAVANGRSTPGVSGRKVDFFAVKVPPRFLCPALPAALLF